MDLPLAGGTFTWSNSHSRSRINRFLVSPDWEVKYPGLIQKRWLRLCLDHFPILLNCDGLIRGKRPFKFENMWLKNEGFVDRVRSWWFSYTFLGNSSFVLARKLKALKADIKRWNEVEFGHVGALFIEKADVLKAMDRLEEERGLGEEDKERKRVISRELEVALLQEESCWRQKSRIHLLKEGDKCTKFFHLIANSNCRGNTIESLLINGSLTSD
jgi:hypothetical protein